VRARSRWTAAGVFGAASLALAPAQADTPLNSGIRIDQLQPASPESAFFRSEGPHNPAAEGVEFAAGLTLEYGKGVLKDQVFNADGTHSTNNLVEHVVLGRVAGSVTPLHWLAFDLSLPFSLYEAGTEQGAVGGKSLAAGKGPGVGDLRMGVHFRPIDHNAFGLILGGRVWAPFGTQPAYLSDGTVRAEIDLGVAGDVGRFLYGCTVNVAPGIFAKRAGDRFATSCAGYVKLGEIVTLGLEPAFEVATIPRISLSPMSPAGNATSVIFEPLGGVRFKVGGFRLGVAAGPGFGGGVGAAEVRALFNAAYVGLGRPPKPQVVGPPDRDLDKIPDSEDACPDEAGPPSKNPKLNGCPKHDRDGDGIADEEDACPDRPGIPYSDPKGNGCPDSDNDGLPDPVDQCVNEPGAPPVGCPKYAHLALGRFTIEPPIDFYGGEKLPTQAKSALEEVAATLRANPKVDKTTFVVGTKGLKGGSVSEKRAQEILRILSAMSLDPARYEVVLRDDVKGGAVQVKIGGKE
jgi:hypothetical protein